MAKKHKYTHTHIIHHEDGSHSIHHEHVEGKHKDYARADHDGMMDGMMEHTSEPDEEEGAAEAGDHGVEEAMAAKAGLPMPTPTA